MNYKTRFEDFWADQAGRCPPEWLLPVLKRLAELPERAGARTVALDGRAASGKTTTASQLAEVLEAGLIHMDDFFLPPELREEPRLAQPGGNIHNERFLREIIPRLTREEAFFYRGFDCETARFGRTRRVRESKWRVVEGAYSCHPAFGDYMELRVFSDITPEKQMERIRARNGEKAAEVFASRWIPLEEAYFQAHRVKERADIVISCP